MDLHVYCMSMRWFFLFLVSPLFAVYIGNPASPSIMNTGFFSGHNPLVKGTTGYIYDYTSNKRYVLKSSKASFDPNSALRTFSLHSQEASFSIIFLERLEIFGTAGGSKERTPAKDPDVGTGIDMQSSYQFSWSTGAKVVLIQWAQTYLSADFTYFAIPESPKTFVKFFNRMNLPIDFGKQKTSLEEWQISAGLSSRLYFITPYIGGTYLHSRLKVESSSESGSLEYKNQYNFGVFFGATVSLTGRFHLNFERRVRDEFGYTFSTVAVF